MSRTSTRAFRELVSSHDVVLVNGMSVGLTFRGHGDMALSESDGTHWVVNGDQLVEFDGKSCAIKGVTWAAGVRTARWLDVSFEMLTPEPPEPHCDTQTQSYKATIEFADNPSNTRVSCNNCGWWSTADFLKPIDDAILTPGDPSPAGRCPDCGSLAYVVESDPEPQFEGFDFSWLAYFPKLEYLPWHVPFHAVFDVDYSKLELRLMANMVGMEDKGTSFADVYLAKPYELGSTVTGRFVQPSPEFQELPSKVSDE